MTKYPRFLLASLLAASPLFAQTTADEVKRQYDEAIAALEKSRAEAVAKVNETFDSQFAAAQEEARKTLVPLAQSFSNKPDEAAKIIAMLDSILAAKNATEATRILGARDHALLVGEWIATRSTRNTRYAYEFPNLQTMIYRRNDAYGGRDGQADFEQVIEYSVKSIDGKITITPNKQLPFHMPGMKEQIYYKKHRYEIPLPFDPIEPKMTLFYDSETMPIPLKKEEKK